MHSKQYKKGFGLLLVVLLFSVFLSPPGEAVEAFNQSNLIRVAEIKEVDGQFFYRRVAPVYEIHP